MQRIALLVLVAFAFSLAAFSADAGKPPMQVAAELSQDTQQQCDKLRAGNADAQQLAQSGCCSWHKGVCGCSGGRTACCDGTLSPSCTCRGDEPLSPPGT